MKRTYQEAIKIVVDFWMEHTFGVFNQYEIPEDEAEYWASEIVKTLTFEEKQQVARFRRRGFKNEQMEQFRYWLEHFLSFYEGKGERFTTCYMDNSPSGWLIDVIENSRIDRLLLPSKAHTYITEDNLVYLRLGHHVGESELL